jgi:5'-nucleotidase
LADKPLILVTNDDGVHAPGIHSLFQALRKVGRPVIVAPERDNSGASHSLTLDRPLRVRKVETDIYTMDGTPTDCVSIGIEKILPERPTLVVSGINPGGNLGDDVTYSGTVSAAIEGTMLGVPSLAISLVGEPPRLFETAAEFAVRLAKRVLKRSLPRDTLLNVNVPNLPAARIEGIRFTRQGYRIYENAIKETFDPWGRKHYWIGGGTPSWDRDPDTDSTAVLLDNCISITPIHLDFTNHEALASMRKSWRF